GKQDIVDGHNHRRSQYKGNKQDRVQHDGKSENHRFVDVEDRRDQGGFPHFLQLAGAREQHEDDQTPGRSGTPDMGKHVEKGLRHDALGHLSGADRIGVFGQLRHPEGIGNRRYHIHSVDPHPPKHHHQQNHAQGGGIGVGRRDEGAEQFQDRLRDGDADIGPDNPFQDPDGGQYQHKRNQCAERPHHVRGDSRRQFKGKSPFDQQAHRFGGQDAQDDLIEDSPTTEIIQYPPKGNLGDVFYRKGGHQKRQHGKDSRHHRIHVPALAEAVPDAEGDRDGHDAEGELKRKQNLRLDRFNRLRPRLNRRPLNRRGRVGDNEKNRARQNDRQRKDDKGIPNRLEINVLGQSSEGFHETVFQPIYHVHVYRPLFVIANT